MTVSVLFEIRDTDPESALSAALRDVNGMPEGPDRDRIIGSVMILRGTQMLEWAAIVEHDRKREKRLRDQRAATRERNRIAREQEASP